MDIVKDKIPPIIYSGEKYLFCSVIGKGSFSSCCLYEPKNKINNNVKIAVKLLPIPKATKPLNGAKLETSKEKWQNEVKVMSMLNHENIVRYFASKEDNQFRYIVMEFCVTDLKKAHLHNPRMPIAAVHSIIRDTLNGLHYMHEKNIIHRDIKLANLLLTANNRVKICDFGLAVIMENDTLVMERKYLCGTRNYFPPELLTAQLTFSKAADIWSTGCIMYALLNGYLPFSANKVWHTLLRIRYAIFRVPNSMKLLPGGYAAMSICKKMLTKSYKERPTSGDLLKEEFFNDNRQLKVLWPESETFIVSMHPIEYFLEALNAIYTPKSERPVYLDDVDRSKLCWLIGFVNYTENIGLPYVLSNGELGTLFLDHKTILFDPQKRSSKQGYTYLNRMLPWIVDRKSAEYKRKMNFFMVFQPELKEKLAKTHHCRTDKIADDICFVTGCYQIQSAQIVTFSNGTMQINVLPRYNGTGLEMLIDDSNIHLFNGKKYISFTREKVPREIRKPLRKIKHDLEELLDSGK